MFLDVFWGGIKRHQWYETAVRWSYGAFTTISASNGNVGFNINIPTKYNCFGQWVRMIFDWTIAVLVPSSSSSSATYFKLK